MVIVGGGQSAPIPPPGPAGAPILPDATETSPLMSQRGGRANQLRVIGGQWRGPTVDLPGSGRPGSRPTPDRVRETLFNWLAPIPPGACCLDLFAGSGALGIEALLAARPRWCSNERHPLAARALRDHLDRLHAHNARVEQADALAWLRQPGTPFEIALLDPAVWARSAGTQLRGLEAGGWLAASAWIYLESEGEAEIALPAC
ncbi:MAG: RsmD family RNA methyltransferase [Candidatus Competibacteraceae bacterium]